MPYDVYLAKERIHNLYNSFCNTSSTKKSVEVSIGSSLFSGKYSHETNSTTNIHTELDVILRNINAVPVTDQFLPEEDEKLYIKMTMPMSWNCQNRIDSIVSSTFWIGNIRHTDSPFFHEIKILLIGSEHNIIGNDNSGHYLSTSYIDGFFKSLEDTFDNDTFETSYFRHPNSLKDDWEFYTTLLKDSKTSPMAASGIQRYYKDRWSYARYIEDLYNNYSGNLCEYSFVAQILICNDLQSTE